MKKRNLFNFIWLAQGKIREDSLRLVNESSYLLFLRWEYKYIKQSFQTISQPCQPAVIIAFTKDFFLTSPLPLPYTFVVEPGYELGAPSKLKAESSKPEDERGKREESSADRADLTDL
jgi:hypothetical protein